MKLPAGTVLGPYERPAWIEARRAGIGGSDIGVLLGLSTFRSELEVYYEKIDGQEPQVTEQMQIGQAIEPWILNRWYQDYVWQWPERAGVVEQRLLIIESNEYPFLLHSPDGLLVENGEYVAGIEVKNVRSDHAWDPLPDFYQAQVQHGLLCSGLDRWIVVALVGGQKLITREVEPDLELQGRIVEAAERFWKAHIVPEIPPEPDGSESAKKALERHWDASEGSCEVDPELWATYRLKKQAMEAADKSFRIAEQRIKAAMEDAEICLVDGKKVATWKVGTRKSVDVTRLKEEDPKLAEKYTKVSTTRVFRVS